MPDLSPIVYVLIVWVLIQAILVAFAVLGGRRRRRRRGRDKFSGDPRLGPSDRRTASRDRRVGLPDLRERQVERRSGSADRRGGSGDRRRTPHATA